MAEEINLARIQYQCRRGMLELDYLLQDFFQQSFTKLSRHEQQSFVNLLNCADQDLYNYLFKKHPAPTKNIQDLIEKIILLKLPAPVE